MISFNPVAVLTRAFSNSAAPLGVTSNAAHNYAEVVSSHRFYTPPPSQSRDLTELYNNNPRIRSIVSKVSRAVAKQVWYLEKSGGKRVDDHPALDFIRAGNPKMRGRRALASTAAYMDLNGEAFWVIGRQNNDPNGRPVMFAPIPPAWVMDVPDDLDNGVFEITPDNMPPYELPARSVLMFRDPDPLRPYVRGSSFVKAMLSEVSADAAAGTFLDKFFKNSARPDLLISGSEKAPMSAPDRARLESYWERFKGATRAGRPFFSTQPLDVKELGKGARDNDVANLRGVLGDVVMQVWGVPPEIFGKLESSNRATIDAASYLFARYTLEPRLEDLHDVLEPFLDAEFMLSARGFTLKYESPIDEDSEHALSVVKAFPGDFTRNEKRNLADRPDVDGGDELFDQIDPADALEAAANANDPADTPPEKPKGGKKPKKTSDKAADTGRSIASPAPVTLNPNSSAVQKAFSPAAIVTVSNSLNDPQVVAEASAILDKVLTDLLQNYGSELVNELGAEVDFEIKGNIAQWLIEKNSTLLGVVNATTTEALLASLVTGVAENEAVDDLIARIDKIFADAADIRAGTIGITEATAVTGFGSQAASELAGFTEKEWLTSQDQNVRDTHRSLSHQKVATSGKFKSSSGATALHPGAFGVAKEDINCRCAMRPIIPGEKALNNSADFLAFHEKQHAKLAKKIETVSRDIFRGQRAVVIAVLKRVAA